MLLFLALQFGFFSQCDALYLAPWGDENPSCGSRTSPCSKIPSTADSVILLTGPGATVYSCLQLGIPPSGLSMKSPLNIMGEVGEFTPFPVLDCLTNLEIFLVNLSSGTFSLSNLEIRGSARAVLVTSGTSIILRNSVFKTQQAITWHHSASSSTSSVNLTLTGCVFYGSVDVLLSSTANMVINFNNVYSEIRLSVEGSANTNLDFSSNIVSIQDNSTSLAATLLLDVSGSINFLGNMKLNDFTNNKLTSATHLVAGKPTYNVNFSAQSNLFQSNNAGMKIIGDGPFFGFAFQFQGNTWNDNLEGALSIEIATNSTGHVVITSDNFSRNRAALGSALRMNIGQDRLLPLDPIGYRFWATGVTTTVVNTVFDSNQAFRDGGAVAVSSGSYLFKNCTFQDNQALEGRGGAYFTSETATTSILGSRFVRNSAKAGGAGYHFGWAGHNISGQTQIELQPKAEDFVVLRGGRILVSEDSSISCPQGFRLTNRSFTAPTRDPGVPFDQTVLKRSITVSCVGCSAGRYSAEKLVSTGSGNGTWVVKPTDPNCQACPFGVDCSHTTGVATAGVKANYWAAAIIANMTAVRCPPGYCCPEKQSPCPVSSCAGHRVGIFCGECPPSFTEAYFSTDCGSTAQCQYFGFWLMTMVYTMAFAFWALSQPASADNRGFSIVVLGFFQSVGLVILDPSSVVTTGLTAVSTFQVPRSSGGGDTLLQICVWPGLTAVGKICLQFVTPLLTAIFVVLIYSLARLVRKISRFPDQNIGTQSSSGTISSGSNNKLASSRVNILAAKERKCRCYECIDEERDKKHIPIKAVKVSMRQRFVKICGALGQRGNLRIAATKVALITHSALTKGVLELLQCIPITLPGEKPQQRLFWQASVQCSTGRQVGLGFALLLLLLLPIILMKLRQRKLKPKDVDIASHQEPSIIIASGSATDVSLSRGKYLTAEQLWQLEGPYRPGAGYWSSVIVLRPQLLLLMAISYDPLIQSVLVCLVTLCYLSALLLIQPFRTRSIHLLESFCSVVLHFIAMMNVRTGSNLNVGVLENDALASQSVRRVTNVLNTTQVVLVLLVLVAGTIVLIFDSGMGAFCTRCLCCPRTYQQKWRKLRLQMQIPDPICTDAKRIALRAQPKCSTPGPEPEKRQVTTMFS